MQDRLIEIGELLGQIKTLPSLIPTPQLRRANKIRTIFATTKIEGNKLNLDEVTALVDGKKVKGSRKDILEVKNVITLYDSISQLNSFSEQDYLLAHKILMKGLIKRNGQYRKVNVAIKSGENDSYKIIFPEYQKVERLCSHMFEYIHSNNDNYIVKSCMIHYLSVSIHPFEDGNGRVSRFWQTLFLAENNDIFKFLPIESYIKSSQDDYYEYLNLSQKADDPTGFIAFMLTLIKSSLAEGIKFDFEKNISRQDGRLKKAKKFFGNSEFTRREYLDLFSSLSTSMATKDLKAAINIGSLNRRGVGSGVKYFF